MLTDGLTPRVIGIDGGGTRCRLAFGQPGEREMIEVGAANVSSDFDAAIGEIERGLKALSVKAGIAMNDLMETPAYLGLAGVTGAALAARVAKALPLRNVRVDNDRHAALRGALGKSDGAVAHFGTGSFFAFQADGRERLAGGWGSRLADEGSAFWVARSALTATLQAVDRLIESTALTDRVLAHFGSPIAIVEFAADASPSEFGAFAPWVTEAAHQGDRVGLQIMRAGTDHIARVIDRMGWHPGMALCLTGGVGPIYRDYLSTPLASAVVAPISAPVDGALDLAREFALELAR